MKLCVELLISYLTLTTLTLGLEEDLQGLKLVHVGRHKFSGV